MVRIIIIAALVVGLAGAAIAWSESRTLDPGSEIRLQEGRQEDVMTEFESDDDSLDDDGDDSMTSGETTFADTYMTDATDDSDSAGTGGTEFKRASTPTSIIKPATTTTSTRSATTATTTRYDDYSVSADSVSTYSAPSYSTDS